MIQKSCLWLLTVLITGLVCWLPSSPLPLFSPPEPEEESDGKDGRKENEEDEGEE